ncbi:SURF1 family protein [Motilimonas sp. KMU-193]|uniref:SURF1 family protein n=1 Tax=Motilimonas sp. KMU-193 TaxID=3388668 RepID=UPI00396B1310
MAWRRISFLLLNLVLIAVMVKAGFWQLDRAEQKQAIISQGQQQVWLSDLSQLWSGEPKQLQAKWVNIKGQFDTEQVWLLDNKVHQGQVGYEVLVALTPQTEGKQRILVNLGWIPAGLDRAQLPDLSALKQWQAGLEVSAQAYLPSQPWLLSEDQLQQTWPQRIQGLAMDKLVAFYAKLGWQLSPVILRISEDSQLGFIKQWPIVAMTPAKHQGYALQWFLMALVSTGLFIWFYRRGGMYVKE